MLEEANQSLEVKVPKFVHALLVEIWKQIGLLEQEWLSLEDTDEAVHKGGWWMSKRKNFMFHPYAPFYALLVLQSRTPPPPCKECNGGVQRRSLPSWLTPITSANLQEAFTDTSDLAKHLLQIAFGTERTWDWKERRNFCVWDYMEFLREVLYPYLCFLESFSPHVCFGVLRASWDCPFAYSVGQETYSFFSCDQWRGDKNPPKGPSL